VVQSETIACQRDLFTIPHDITYLNCANMGPQLKSATEAGLEAVRANSAPWLRTAPDWFTGPERLRGLAARLLNADADCVALVPSVSYGIAVAASNVRVAPGQTIVILDQQFPSNVYAWRELARRTGAQVRTVRREQNHGWTEPLLAAIDSRTAVVAVPNCHWADGGRVDLERVATAARGVGASLVIDATQSLGAYPLDVASLRPDFLVAAGYKWLLGPYGLGYLYVAPRWQSEGAPLEHSWLGRAGSENFARLTQYTDEFRPGARRFDVGECSQFTTLPIASAALEQVLSWGVARIQRSLSALTAQVAAGAEQIGATTLPAADRVGHLIGVRMPSSPDARLAQALAAARVYVSIRGDYVRVSPYLYNDAADVERLIAVLAAVTTSRAI
jgi:selenocysteine lyase/cysteine desulfurase